MQIFRKHEDERMLNLKIDDKSQTNKKCKFLFCFWMYVYIIHIYMYTDYTESPSHVYIQCT